jgi:hypothetical protein
MKTITFKLDGHYGYIHPCGTITWMTIGCRIESLGDCPLRDAVLKALNLN